MMILSSCTMFSQTQEKELDTTYLYIPYKIYYTQGAENFSPQEKTNLDYIFNKVIEKGYDTTNLFILSVDHCPNELEKDELISYKRINNLWKYLVYDKGINLDNIRIIYGGIANEPSCKRMGILINTQKK